MPTSTYQTYLMHDTGGTEGPVNYEKLVDIKDFPDLGGTREMLPTTTLSDAMETYISGIQKAEAYEFTLNYDKNDFTKLKALEGKQEKYAVYFGEEGTEGKFEITGEASVYITGAGTNAVREMKLSIAPSKVLEISK